MLIPSLVVNGIFPKVFCESEQISGLRSVKKVVLHWSDHSLRGLLESCFNSALDEREKPTKFNDLFEESDRPFDPEQELIHAANGSRARLFDLGNRLIRHHCENPDPAYYMNITELKDILSHT